MSTGLQPSPSAGADFAQRALRVFRMSTVLAAGSVLRLGLEKFVLIPLVLPTLGAETLGKFVLLLGWAQVLGQFAPGGVSDALLRLYREAQEKRQWQALLATATVLTGAVSLAVMLAGGGGFMLFRGGWAPTWMIWGAAGLGAYSLLQAIQRIAETGFRVELQFGRMGVVQVVAGVLLLGGIPAAYLLGFEGLALTYAAAELLAVGVQFWLLRGRGFGHRMFDPAWAGRLCLVAPTFVLASALGIASIQASRLVLGAYRPYELVTVCYVAESVILMALGPLDFVAKTIYTLIARKGQPGDIPRQAILQHVLASLLCSVATFLAINLAGRWILRQLFSSVAEEAWPVVSVLSYGGAAKVLVMFTRGFLYRFGSYRRIILYSAIDLLVLLPCLLVSVPRWGLMGAAYSITISQCVSGAVWFGTYLWAFLVKGAPQRAGPS